MTNDIVDLDKKPTVIDRHGDNRLLSRSKSINDTDKTGRQRLFPPADATYSLFSENKLLLDED